MKNKFPDFKKIQSPDNGKYKSWQKLLSRKYRDREKAFLVEGELLINDAISSGANPKEIIIREDSSIELEFLTMDKTKNVSVYEIADSLFQTLNDTENGRDVIGVFEVPHVDISEWQDGDIAVLDRIQDPGNLGTIIRTADAGGISGIIAIKGTVDPFSPKVVRAAAGSIFRVPILKVENTVELTNVLQELKATPVAIDPRDGKPYYELPDDMRIAVIVGNEGSGIDDELLDISDMTFTIPMREGIESLNAAMAFGITIYERVRRKCRKD